MTKTPLKSEILAKAIELFHDERVRCGDPSFAITPTEQELTENGFIQTAKSTLMRDQYRSQIESKDYMENLEDFQFNVFEALQNGIYTVGSRGCGKSDLNMYVAQKLMKDGVIVLVFDPSMDWLKRSSILKYVSVKPYMAITIPNESMIYDLSLLTLSQQREFVERFNRALVEYQISNVKEQWYFNIYEEAHTYFYQGSMRSKAMQYTVRALTQGRNFRISMALVTQFSSMVDKDTMKFMVQRFFGVSNEPNDVEYLKGFLGKNVEELKSLDNGEFLYFNRGKISKVSIEPYTSNISKTQIRQTEPFIMPISEPKPKQNYNNTQAISSLIVAFMWFIAVVLALHGRGF
jgi:hypothetical protein